MLAGAARASIAPRPNDLAEGVYLGGFGTYRQRRATAVHDEPECRALAVGDADRGFVLAVLDLVGAGERVLADIRADASRLTGVPKDHVIVACTHSHASPDLQGLWGGVGAGYRTHVVHRASSAIWEAWTNRGAAHLRVATTSLEGIVRNRRGWPQTDTTLTTLGVVSTDGAPIATLVNYACHPTAIGAANTEVSRDWCGFAVDAVERATGGIGIYVNGVIGDAVPADAEGYEGAAAFGEAVAGAAVASLQAATDIAGDATVRTVGLELPVNVDRLSERIEHAIARAGFALSALSRAGGLHAAALALHAARRPDLAQLVAALEGMTQRGLMRRGLQTFVQTRCGLIMFGSDFEAILAPGEVLTRLGLVLRASVGSRHQMFFGLAHDTLGYFVPADEWMSGRNDNYEERVSMGKHAAGALADALLAIVPHHSERV